MIDKDSTDTVLSFLLHKRILKVTESTIRLHLRVPLRVHLMSWTLVIAIYALIALLVPERSLIMVFVLWTVMVIRAPFYAPDMTVVDQGIIVRRFGRERLLTWDAIKGVRVGTLNSQVFPRDIHPVVRTILFDSLLIMRWREHYQEAIEIIRKHVQEVQMPLSRRVYEE